MGKKKNKKKNQIAQDKNNSEDSKPNEPGETQGKKKSKIYFCYFCKNRDFYDKSSLNRHYRRKHKDKLGKCKFCQNLFFPLTSHEKKCIFKYNPKKNDSNNDINPDKQKNNKDNELSKNSLIENEFKNSRVEKIENGKNENINTLKKINNTLTISKEMRFIIQKNVINDSLNKIKHQTNEEKKNNADKGNLTLLSKDEIFNLFIENNTYNVHKNYLMFIELIIGSGSYGTVYFGVKKKPLELVAIKSQDKKRIHFYNISKEIKILKELRNVNVIPKIIEDFPGTANYYIIQQLQGPSLKKYINYSKSLDYRTTLNISIELLLVIKNIHKNGIIHNDLKEDNIITLIKPALLENKKIHLTIIDYGLSYKYIDNNGKHLKINYKTCGNYFYASNNVLSGGLISRKDDIISLFYIMLKLAGNELPWESKKINEHPDKDYKKKMLKAKENIKYNFINDKNYVFRRILEDIDSINYEESPNYEKYVNWLTEELNNLKNENQEYKFIWQKLLKERFSELQENGKNYENDEQIKSLFAGYPKDLIKYMIQ